MVESWPRIFPRGYPSSCSQMIDVNILYRRGQGQRLGPESGPLCRRASSLGQDFVDVCDQRWAQRQSPATQSTLTMQKIVQRRLAAETNVKRRVGRMKLRKDSDNKWQDTMSMKNRNAHLRFTVQNERKNRREDWERGPRLAPKRDVGVLADKYGTVDQSVLFITKPKPSERWEGGTWVAEGDRVVFLKGQDKGKIGEVAAVDVEKQTVHLKEHAKVSPFLTERERCPAALVTDTAR